VAAERRRRFQQMNKDISRDQEASHLKPSEPDSLLEAVNSLRAVLVD
jgi:hypothetical protein